MSPHFCLMSFTGSRIIANVKKYIWDELSEFCYLESLWLLGEFVTDHELTVCIVVIHCFIVICNHNNCMDKDSFMKV